MGHRIPRVQGSGRGLGPGGRCVPGFGVPAGCGLPPTAPPFSWLARSRGARGPAFPPLLIGAWVARPPRGCLARGELTQAHLPHWGIGCGSIACNGAASAMHAPVTPAVVSCGGQRSTASSRPAWATRQLFQNKCWASIDRTEVAWNVRSWTSSPASLICHLSTFEMDTA